MKKFPLRPETYERIALRDLASDPELVPQAKRIAIKKEAALMASKLKEGKSMNTQPVLIPIENIDHNPYQPRQVEDPVAIAEIAESIKRNGLMQIPTARRVNGRYQLAFGHTRLAAIKLNGEKQMPLIERELTDLQMFELGVSENIKRRDLNPIEEAESMRRYMQDFGKTSVEAGEFFAVSEETVRGKVRLLNLPDVARQKLAEGAITVNAARSLLTLQRVAPEKVIIKTVEEIEKKRDRMLPDEVIEETFRHKLEDTVTMHSGEGKPRSSYRAGWVLDMKNFPNKMLPDLTPVDAAIALGIQDDPDMMARSTAFLQSKLGELDSEDLKLLGLGPSDLQLPADMAAKIEHLLNPPSCSSCPFYARIQGSHFCGMKVCHSRKTIAWKEHTILQASKNLKIEFYQKSDGPYKLLDYGDSGLFEKRHNDLRLIPSDQVGYVSQWNFKGVDDNAFAVVATGKAIDKVRSDKQTKGGKKTTAELIKMRQLRVYRPRRRELIWEFVLSAKCLFDAVPYPVLKTVHRWEYLMKDLEPSKEVMIADNAKVDAEKADYLRCIIVWKMAVDGTWNELNNVTKFADIVKRLEKLATEWGVTMPKKLAIMAEQFQAEVDAIAAQTR